MWSSSAEWSLEMRPDRWGIVIDSLDVPGEQLRLVYIFEYLAGRYSAPDIQRLISGFVSTGKYVVIGHLTDLTYDFQFPPHVTEEEKIRFITAVSAMHQKKMEQNPEDIM